MHQKKIINFADNKKRYDMNMRDKIEYVIVVLGEFARRYALTYKEAYNYIEAHRGFDVIDKSYNVEHLFSVEDAVDDVVKYCKRYGGALG